MPWLTVFLKRGSPKRLEVAIPIVVTLAALLVFLLTTISKNDSATSRFVEKLELQSLDARFHLRGERPHDDNIVIVGLDEQTLQQVGAFPIPRNTYAQMVDRLAQAGAQAIAFDANFPVPEKNSAVEVLNVLESRVPSSDPALRLQIKDMK